MPRHRCSPSPTRTTLLALTLVSGAAIRFDGATGVALADAP